MRYCQLTVLLLSFSLALPANAQYGQIGPSKGEIVGIAIGVGAGVGVASYLLYRSMHKGASLEGCVVNDGAQLSLKTKNNQTYALTGDTAGLKAGEHVVLRGKKVKNNAGSFAVQKLANDYGACTP